MTIRSLYKKIVSLGINPYDIIGWKSEDYLHIVQFFIRKYDGKWEVFHWADGNLELMHQTMKRFRTENEATHYIYKEICADVEFFKRHSYTGAYYKKPPDTRLQRLWYSITKKVE